jgi:hypothetical protein
MKDIRDDLIKRGYKIDFWYDKGELDTICVAKYNMGELKFKKEYKIDDIARIIFDDYLKKEE